MHQKHDLNQIESNTSVNLKFWPTRVKTQLGDFILDINKKNEILDKNDNELGVYFEQFIRSESSAVYILKGDYSGLSIVKIPTKLFKSENFSATTDGFAKALSEYFEKDKGLFISFIDPIYLFPDSLVNKNITFQRNQVVDQLKNSFKNTHIVWAPYYLRELKIELECILLLFKATVGHD